MGAFSNVVKVWHLSWCLCSHNNSLWHSHGINVSIYQSILLAQSPSARIYLIHMFYSLKQMDSPPSVDPVKCIFFAVQGHTQRTTDEDEQIQTQIQNQLYSNSMLGSILDPDLSLPWPLIPQSQGAIHPTNRQHRNLTTTWSKSNISPINILFNLCYFYVCSIKKMHTSP